MSLVVYLGVMAATSIMSALDPNLAPFCLISLVAFYFTMTLPNEAAALREAEQLVDGHTERLHLVKDGVLALAKHRKKAGESR